MGQLRSAKHPLVTVVMPAYNAAQTIEASIRSVQTQTVTDWKLIVVDDGSTDDTGVIVRRLSAVDRRIAYIRIERSGVCRARNVALEQTTSKYVALLDSDDLMRDVKFERQLAFLHANPEVKVLGTWGERVNERGIAVAPMNLGPLSVAEYRRMVARGEVIYLLHSSVMAETSALLECQGYLKEDYPAEDVLLWSRVAKKYPVLTLPENLTSYRLSANGVTGSALWGQMMQTRRLEYCLKNDAQIGIDAFEKLYCASRLRSIGFRLHFAHRWLFRKGACRVINGRLVTGVAFVIAAFLADPVHVCRRILHRA